MADRDRDRDRRKGPPPSAVLDRLQKLRYTAQTQNKWDAYAWSDVVEDLKGLPISGDTRAAYEEVLAVLPSATSVWCRYAAAELSPAGSLDNAKLLFGRCLLACPSVDLYQHYLAFVKRSNEGRGPAGLAELRQAYEFSLDLVGQDMDAGGLWREYVEFLKSTKPGSEPFNVLFPGALEGQEEAARTPVVRRAYQRAVVVPTSQLEALWRDYEAWELKVDKQLGRKVLDEFRPRFQAARGTLRERRRKLDAINPTMLPFPPGMGAGPQIGQVVAWQSYVAFEKSNPQRLESDSPVLQSRISLAYSQALDYMWTFPEMWHEYAAWAAESGGLEKAGPVLARAQTALPSCVLFHFVQADMLEAQGDAEAARQVYEGLCQQLEAELPQPAAEGTTPADPTPSPFGGEQGALIWVQYMRFLRRSSDVGSARATFLRARSWQQASPATSGAAPVGTQGVGKGTGWQVYAAAATFEWQADRSSSAVACRIFELGLEDPRLAKDPEFIIAYHKFLVEAGDTDNARALFERGLAEPEVASSADVWRMYAAFEYEQGDVGAAGQVEQRMRAALAAHWVSAPEKSAQSALSLSLLKYGFRGALPCAPTQRRHLQRAAGLEVTLTAADEAEIGERFLAERGPPVDRERFESEPRDLPPPRDRERDFRGPPPGRDEGPPPRAIPDLLEQLAMDLPPPHALEGPPVPIEAVMDVVMFWQMTPEAIAFVCAELDAGRMPPSSNGIEVPQVLDVVRRGVRGFDGFDEPSGMGYPPPHLGPPRGPPHDPYGPAPPDPYYDVPPDPYYDGPPGPGPMARKRRWDSERDREGPYGPPGDFGGPPPPHWGRDERGPPRGPPR